MEDLVDTLTLGNPPAVKTVLASVAAALAVYQLVLIVDRIERQDRGASGGDRDRAASVGTTTAAEAPGDPAP